MKSLVSFLLHSSFSHRHSTFQMLLHLAQGEFFLAFNIRRRGSSDLIVHEGQAEKGINGMKKNRYPTVYVAGVLHNLLLAPTRAGSGSQEAGQQSAQQPIHSLLYKGASNTEKNCSLTSCERGPPSRLHKEL